MRKQLTITLDEQVYNGIHAIMGQGDISHFIEMLARQRLTMADNTPQLEQGYRAMAADTAREAEAAAWSEAFIGDAFDATR